MLEFLAPLSKMFKTGKMLNMFNFLGMFPKVLRTEEMFNLFNMFNPEGKYGKGIEHGKLPLRIEHIEHIEHSPVLSTFLWTCPKKIEILSVSSVLGTS